MTDRFSSPSQLREFALETASQLREAGEAEACRILEEAATFVSGSGWEWLGELAAATEAVLDGFKLPVPVRERLARIRKAAKSQRTYD